MGAAWDNDMYTREGLKDVNLLSHALQDGERKNVAQSRTFSSSPSSKRSFSTQGAPSEQADEPSNKFLAILAAEQSRNAAKGCGTVRSCYVCNCPWLCFCNITVGGTFTY